MNLSIEIPKGYEIDTFDKQTGVVTFKEKPKSVIERISSVETLLAEYGLTVQELRSQCAGLTEDEIAYRILKILTIVLNEGWTPNWSDFNESKYYPCFEMGGSSGFRFDDCVSWLSFSDVGSRFCFKSAKLAQHAGKHFTEVYKQFMT